MHKNGHFYKKETLGGKGNHLGFLGHLKPVQMILKIMKDKDELQKIKLTKRN